jgi:hypothetical protein
MTDRPLDRWRDLMVAALYDELEPDERHELDQAIAADQELQRDWQELVEARQLVAALDADRGPGAGAPWIEGPAQPAIRRGAGRPLAWLGLAAAAGFILGAGLLAAMLVAGLRVDRTTAGLLVHFGGGSRPAQLVEPEWSPAAALAAADRQRQLTRAELAAFAQAVLETTDARLDELERRQTDAQVMLTRALYESLARSQQRHYDDLRNRIDLAAYQTAGMLPGGAVRRIERGPEQQGGQR